MRDNNIKTAEAADILGVSPQFVRVAMQQGKHNNVVERVYKLEKDQAVLDEKQEVANHRIKDLEGLSAQ